MKDPILLPVMILVSWSMVMWLWMLCTRVPAIIKNKMRLDPHAPRGHQMNSLPSAVRWKADNYNHLMEQPTLFYATVLVLAVVGHGEELNVVLAWIYVVLRIIHSLIQSLVNNIKWRFIIFTISSLVLVLMIISCLRLIVG